MPRVPARGLEDAQADFCCCPQAGSPPGSAASSCQCGGSLRSGPVRVTRLHLGVPAARRPGSAQDPTGAAGDSALARAHGGTHPEWHSEPPMTLDMPDEGTR